LLWRDSGGGEEFSQHHPLVQLNISNLIHTNTISAFVEKKSSCVAKLQHLISSGLLLGRVHRQPAVDHWWWRAKCSKYSSRESPYSLECNLFVRFNFFFF
jgi:hypothetical protein